MKITLTIIITAITIQLSYGQINMSDSTAQIIGYWSIGDKQTYDISYEKYKVADQDTTSRMMIKYEVDITVKDSTENSYTIEWFYKNYEVDTENELVKKISKATEDISVVIKTDEFGAILEVINWEEVKDHMTKAMKPLLKKLKKLPGAGEIIAQSLATFNNKAAIEANTIKDAVQFYAFHGGAYKLNENIIGQMQFANNFGGKPFDADVIINLEELNEEDDNCIIRMSQIINPEQLTKATYDYLEKIGTFGDKMPDISTMPAISNEIRTASRIHGWSGWVLYSSETKEVNSQGNTNIETRIIQIK